MLHPNKCYLVDSCRLQNRLYAITVIGIFFLFSFELLGWIPVMPFGTFRWNRTKSYNRNASPRPTGSDFSPGSSSTVYDFPFMLRPEQTCSSRNTSFVVAVTSTPLNFARRRAIRETWGNRQQQRSFNVAVMFLLGTGLDCNVQDQLVSENQIHEDLLQGDFIDSYSNLTLKSVMALRWANNFCPGVKYFMKTDDDIFVNLPNLVSYLTHKLEPTHSWIVGCIKNHVGQPVMIKAAKAVYDFHPSLPSPHPPFVAGAGYVISGKAIGDLYSTAVRTRYLSVEDAFITGHCARKIGLFPEHDDRFSCGEAVTSVCKMINKFTGHKVTPSKQKDIWKKLKDLSCEYN
ncbi:beta-1,3-galactosyltransferase 1-like [Limulus polyphemus]|uniref:Hexosyltransferase n=1 Tax=Limulus polyphemus TaxID=6850 RepID=A0ABM1RYA5_LIMPO|nr:beta-1,3-galactosyltransferase 1-like [Limulus polyphemus]